MRILLVDDDPAILQSLSALLPTEGHEVRTAGTGGQAIQAAMGMGGVDLLIADVVMEPMDGFTLRDHLTTRFPEVRTIFISGYDLSDYGVQTANHQVLAKPVEHAELLAALEREFPSAEPEAAPTFEAEPEPELQPEPEPAPAPPPVPVPMAVAQPRAVAAVSTPTAAGVPMGTAVVATVPRATATVKAVAAPAPAAKSPTAVATPRAAVAAPTVKAAGAGPVARPSAPQAVQAVSAPVNQKPPPVPAYDTSLVGQTIGSYQVISPLGQGRWGSVYLAVQISINRQVGLKVLADSQAADETVKGRFLGDARAKAHVQHPSILAVYEAGEASGHIFYTHEYVDGRTLAEIQSSGERLQESAALKVLKVVAEGLNYLNINQIAHSAPDSSSVFLGNDGHPRLANLATQLGDQQVPVEQEIQALGRTMLAVLPAIQTLTPGFRALLSRMMQPGPQAIASWPALAQGVKALEPKVVPLEAAKISAQDRAAAAAVEAARLAQRRSLRFNIAGMVSLITIAALVVWRMFFYSAERALEQQVPVPAGSFIFGDNKTAETGEFWIDKYEISLGQYAKFVEFLEQHPTSEYDDPRQPRSKTSEMHKPKDWNVYHGRAEAGNSIHGVPSDLNMPAIMVDWWDAAAYAKWKGRELPTEQEWEKAARGTTGFLYPWGNDFDPRKLNSGADYTYTDPAARGKIDGYNYWGPVDKQADKSPFGAVGMAGNVSEWTGSWTKDQRFPIIKGGNYSVTDARLDKRIDNVAPSTAQENIGFRTVTHTAPRK